VEASSAEGAQTAEAVVASSGAAGSGSSGATRDAPEMVLDPVTAPGGLPPGSLLRPGA
jgi:hypothetical protein